MTMTTNGVNTHNHLKQICDFISRYSSTLLACGATTIRIERNIERIAAVYDTSAEITVLPMHIMVTVWDSKREHSYTANTKIKSNGIDFDKNSELSKLSWNIYDNHLSLEEADSRFNAIMSRQRLNQWLVLLLASLANASFCHLFGGDTISMIIVFVATANGFFLKDKLHSDWQCDLRIATIIAGCVATIIASSGYVFGLGDTPDITLGTGVLFLVPGVPFINAFSDLVYGHYICFMSRLIHASIITICLSLGLILGLMIINIKYI